MENKYDYIVKESVSQEEEGAHILDVNVGLPDIDEVAMMKEAVQEIQSITNLPLQIDTAEKWHTAPAAGIFLFYGGYDHRK